MHGRAHLEVHEGTHRKHMVYTTSERTEDKRINGERTRRRAPSHEGKARSCVQLKGVQSRYFELFWPHTKLPLNGKKPENNSLIR